MKKRRNDVDWASIAQTILDHGTHPAAIIDRGGKVRGANVPLSQALGWPHSEIKGRPWPEVFGVRDESDAKKMRAFVEEGRQTLRAFELGCTTRRGDRMTLLMRPQRVGQGRQAALLLTAEAVRPGPAAAAPSVPRVLHYEVTGRDAEFGILRHVWAFEPATKGASLGRRCFEALYARQSPCIGCPAPRISAGGPDTLTSVVRRSRAKPRFDVTTARANGAEAVQVSAWPIDEDQLGELIAAKVDELSERAGLSKRERSVLDHLLLGQSRDEIASALRISVSTIKYHQRNLERKMGAESRVDLFRLVIY